MGFRQADSEGRGGFARLWCSDIYDKYSTARLNTWRKTGDSTIDNPIYETDFQEGYVRFIGQAHTRLQELDLPSTEEYLKNRENDDWKKSHPSIVIQIKSCEVQISYDYKTKKAYTNYVVYAFDIPEENDSSSTSAAKKSTAKTSTKTKTKKEEPAEETGEDDLPF